MLKKLRMLFCILVTIVILHGVNQVVGDIEKPLLDIENLSSDIENSPSDIKDISSDIKNPPSDSVSTKKDSVECFLRLTTAYNPEVEYPALEETQKPYNQYNNMRRGYYNHGFRRYRFGEDIKTTLSFEAMNELFKVTPAHRVRNRKAERKLRKKYRFRRRQDALNNTRDASLKNQTEKSKHTRSSHHDRNTNSTKIYLKKNRRQDTIKKSSLNDTSDTFFKRRGKKPKRGSRQDRRTNFTKFHSKKNKTQSSYSTEPEVMSDTDDEYDTRSVGDHSESEPRFTESIIPKSTFSKIKQKEKKKKSKKRRGKEFPDDLLECHNLIQKIVNRTRAYKREREVLRCVLKALKWEKEEIYEQFVQSDAVPKEEKEKVKQELMKRKFFLNLKRNRY